MPETEKQPQAAIERVGAGGEVGKGQTGTPLHKPHGVRDRELGERERVGAGGPIGNLNSDAKTDRNDAIDDATREIVEAEIETGAAGHSVEPDQKDEVP
jgi:hypothetical protein